MKLSYAAEGDLVPLNATSTFKPLGIQHRYINQLTQLIIRRRPFAALLLTPSCHHLFRSCYSNHDLPRLHYKQQPEKNATWVPFTFTPLLPLTYRSQ